MKRSGFVLGGALLLLGVYGTGLESGSGLSAFWEHWWCPTPLVVIMLGLASLITAYRLSPDA